MISTRNCPHGDRGRKKWTSLQDWQGNEKVTTTADIAHMSPVPTDPYMYTHTHTHTVGLRQFTLMQSHRVGETETQREPKPNV